MHLDLLSIPQSGGKNTVLFFLCFVCFLPIHSRHQVRWTYQPGSHRISHPPSFCGACLIFSREKDSAISFPRRYPTHIKCGCPGLFRFCSLVFPLLNPFLAMMSSAGYFHARFLLSAFFSFFPTVFVPDLFRCNFLYLVTTAGFVADQLIM